jgi:hypothetical protein
MLQDAGAVRPRLDVVEVWGDINESLHVRGAITIDVIANFVCPLVVPETHSTPDQWVERRSFEAFEARLVLSENLTLRQLVPFGN